MRKTIAVLIEEPTADDAAAYARYLDTNQTIPDGDHAFVGYDGSFSTMSLYHEDDLHEGHFMHDHPALVNSDVAPYDSREGQEFLDACTQGMREQFAERAELLRSYLQSYSTSDLFEERVPNDMDNDPPVAMFRFHARSIGNNRIVNVFTQRGRALETPRAIENADKFLDDENCLYVAAFAVSF